MSYVLLNFVFVVSLYAKTKYAIWVVVTGI